MHMHSVVTLCKPINNQLHQTEAETSFKNKCTTLVGLELPHTYLQLSFTKMFHKDMVTKDNKNNRLATETEHREFTAVTNYVPTGHNVTLLMNLGKPVTSVTNEHTMQLRQSPRHGHSAEDHCLHGQVLWHQHHSAQTDSPYKTIHIMCSTMTTSVNMGNKALWQMQQRKCFVVKNQLCFINAV